MKEYSNLGTVPHVQLSTGHADVRVADLSEYNDAMGWPEHHSRTALDVVNDDGPAPPRRDKHRLRIVGRDSQVDVFVNSLRQQLKPLPAGHCDLSSGVG